jgi:hypothetical protein
VSTVSLQSKSLVYLQCLTLASLHSALVLAWSADLNEATFIFFACSRICFSWAATACNMKSQLLTTAAASAHTTRQRHGSLLFFTVVQYILSHAVSESSFCITLTHLESQTNLVHCHANLKKNEIHQCSTRHRAKNATTTTI